MNALFSIRHKVIEAPKHEEFDVIKDDEEYKYFKDCIGAIDGTYIPVAKYKSGDKYFCKDGFSCLNVMVAVDFNLKFRYVHSDCEGSVDDFRVLMKALKSKSFVIPKGAYYLADGDYEISDQFLTPYENTRYDLNEYKVTPPQKGEELFNMRHGVLRNYADRTIVKLKNRFRIMREASEYSPEVVSRLVQSLAVIHNFVEDHNSTADEIYDVDDEILDEDYFETDDEDDFNDSNESVD